MAVKKVKLTVEEEVNNFVMPGVEYALYVPWTNRRHLVSARSGSSRARASILHLVFHPSHGQARPEPRQDLRCV